MMPLLARNGVGIKSYGMLSALVVVTLLLWMSQPAYSTVIDFENQPSLAAQPSSFGALTMQTYISAGIFSISGGVVLGNPNFLTPFATHGSSPNAYGTCDFADPSLLQTIELDLPLAEGVISVTGVLFNGQNFAESYTVTAFSGVNQVDSNAFNNMADDSSASGFGNVSLSSNAANPITQVLFTTPNAQASGWDFFVDTITLTTSAAAIPEPATVVGVALGIALLGLRRMRRS